MPQRTALASVRSHPSLEKDERWGTRPLIKTIWSGFVVSHSSTIKLWMNGAHSFLVIS